MKREEPVKSFNWEHLLRHHSIFSSLDEKEIEEFLKGLLKVGVSTEKPYSRGDIILEEGVPGDSVFLIGSGSVQVVARGKDGQEIPLSILGPGCGSGEHA